jgi:hypothetical protein
MIRSTLIALIASSVLTMSGCGSGSFAQPPSSQPPPTPSALSISSLSPSSAMAGNPDLTLTITGSNLDLLHSGSHQTNTVAVWTANGTDTTLKTTVLGETQLTAAVPASLLVKPVAALLSVQKYYFADDSPFLVSNTLSFIVSATPKETFKFTVTGSMLAARSGHSATLLGNGMVLVAGGADGLGVLDSAELYDPTKGMFTTTGTLIYSRQGHTATMLADGKVLIAGGEDNVGPIGSAELYDPVTGKFSLIGNMSNARWSHTATLLANGKVLIAGGANNTDSQDSAELFDPDTRSFAAIGNMISARMHHTATLLPNGTVLLVGGWSSYSPITSLTSAEVYDPVTSSFASTANMSIPHWNHSSISLPDGKVLIMGGSEHQFSTSVIEAFNPASQVFAVAGNLRKARRSHTATLLPDGTVLITGGINEYPGPDAPELTVLATCELHSSASQTSSLTAALTGPRVGHTATLLNDGRVLITGGTHAEGNALATAELFQ